MVDICLPNGARSAGARARVAPEQAAQSRERSQPARAPGPFVISVVVVGTFVAETFGFEPSFVVEAPFVAHVSGTPLSEGGCVFV